jgi:alpha-glucosidase
MIHYLYTTFKHANDTGCPIIRPMWYEFPKDISTFELDRQFMFGDSLLVAPKIFPARADLHAPVATSVYLPEASNWFYYYSGKLVEGSSKMQSMLIPELEQGVWVKEGSIIPLLDFEPSRGSLL